MKKTSKKLTLHKTTLNNLTMRTVTGGQKPTCAPHDPSEQPSRKQGCPDSTPLSHCYCGPF